MSRIAVIGGGFSGLSSACFLAKDGHEVTIYEKNESVGGRARTLEAQGFTFDMGPSWYWMPDIFESFFGHFGTHPSRYYDLIQLDPGFQVIFGKDDVLQVPARLDDIYQVFEQLEAGSASRLREFLAEAEKKYNISMSGLVYKPCLSWGEFVSLPLLRDAFKLSVFHSISTYVRTFFKHPHIIALMEFPSLFLGAMPDKIPALYSMMNYAALSLGTWYPMGGIGKVVEGMGHLALSLGVTIRTGCEVQKIETANGSCTAVVMSNGERQVVDAMIASNDYHNTDQLLLHDKFSNYDDAYWQKRVMAPSCLVFYVGVRKKLPKLIHHNLFFDASMHEHAQCIYQKPSWPEKPLFYVCCPSKTDASVAPAGMENLFILVPIASGSEDTPAIREEYFHKVMQRIEEYCGETFLYDIVYKKSYCVKDFVADYNAFKGNAYGLANTLMQTAVLKPAIRNKKLKNLFYAGQLTVPGPGVPPALISGQIAAQQLSGSISH